MLRHTQVEIPDVPLVPSGEVQTETGMTLSEIYSLSQGFSGSPPSINPAQLLGQFGTYPIN